jgi:hypothetical protein
MVTKHGFLITSRPKFVYFVGAHRLSATTSTGASGVRVRAYAHSRPACNCIHELDGGKGMLGGVCRVSSVRFPSGSSSTSLTNPIVRYSLLRTPVTWAFIKDYPNLGMMLQLLNEAQFAEILLRIAERGDQGETFPKGNPPDLPDSNHLVVLSAFAIEFVQYAGLESMANFEIDDHMRMVITLWSIFLKGTIRRASPGWHDDHQSPTLGREVQRIDRQIDRQGCDRAWHDDSPLIRACGVLGHRGLKGKPTRPLGHSVISDGLLH